MAWRNHSLTLQVLLEQFWRVTHRVSAKCVKILLAEESDVVQRGVDQVQGYYFLLSLSDVFFENSKSIAHKLICHSFQVWLLQRV